MNRIGTSPFHNWLRKGGKLLLALIIFIMLLSLLNQSPWEDWESTMLHHHDGTTDHLETEWVLTSGEQVLQEQVDLPCFLKMEPDTTYTMTTTLSYSGQQDVTPAAFFYAQHMYCKAFLDGEEIFNLDDCCPKPRISKSPGLAYIAAPLPQDCMGKEFRLEFSPSLNIDMEYELPPVRFGNYSTIMFSMLKEDILFNLITLFFAFVGISCILFTSLTLKGSSYREGLFIGIFSLLFAIYNLTESDFNVYVIANPYYTYVLNYATLSSIQIAFLAFMRERFSGKQKTICTGLVMFSAAVVVLEAWLHASGRLDLREFLPCIQALYFLEIVAVFVLLHFLKPGTQRRGLLLQLLPILIGMVLDATVYYGHWANFRNDTTFTNAGVIIFLLFEIRHGWRSSLAIYTESIHCRHFQEMAYVDSLTGIGNRRAFDAACEKLQSGAKEYKTLTVASVDINNLKVANDTLGHAAGDYLIRSTANILSDFVAGCGNAFRTGGDEFVAFLYDVSPEEFDRRVEAGKAVIADLNQNSEVQLSLSLGCETISDRSILDAVRLADQRMYREKQRKKSEQNEPVRSAFLTP